MADPSLLLTPGESSLPMAASHASPGLASQGLETQGVSEGRFASVLQARLQPPDGERVANGQIPGSARGAADTIEPLPPAGNVLPAHSLSMAEAVAHADLLAETVTLPVLPPAPDSQLAQSGAALSDSAPIAGGPLPTPHPLQPHGSELPQMLAAAGDQISLQDSSPRATQLLATGTVQQGETSPILPAAGLSGQAHVSASGPLSADHVQLARQTHRPLSSEERLLLHRLNNAGYATSQASLQSQSATLDKALEGGVDKTVLRDMQALNSMENRRPILAALQAAALDERQMTSEFKPLLTQASSTMLSSLGQVEDSTYTTVMQNVQRAPGGLPGMGMPVLNVATSVGQPGWSQEMGQRVTWMAGNEVREAQLQLNPRHLGPLEVRISFGHDQQLNVNFMVTNPQAREAVDAAMPRLREMFEQQGMNLQDANVSQESFADQQQRRGQTPSFTQDDSVLDDTATELDMAANPSTRREVIAQGMIDTYA